jgi:uncharacterized membrane protein
MSNNRTLLIVLIVAAITIFCCCPILAGALYWLWQNGDALVGNTSHVIPTLLML